MSKRTRDGNIIAPYKLRNYVTSNHLEDWLISYGVENGYKPAEHVGPAPKRARLGEHFEELVREELAELFGEDEVVTVISNISQIGDAKAAETIKHMKAGKKVIYQAMLQNKVNGTHGVADFLIRSDVVNTVFTDYTYPSAEVGSKLSSKWHYVVIDTKFSKLNLCADGLRIRNDDTIRFYKLQLYIYNLAVAQIQGYEPSYGLIVGRGHSYTTKGQTHSSISCFSKPGVIEFVDWDKFVAEQLDGGLKWLDRLHVLGAEWEPLPEPTVPELYANLKSDGSPKWQATKVAIGKEQNVLTQLWNVTAEHQEKGALKGLFSVDTLGRGKNGKYTDSCLDTHLDTLGFKKGNKTTITLSKIVKAQNVAEYAEPEVSDDVIRALDGYENWVYLDFETWSNANVRFDMPKITSENYVYLIGIFHKSKSINFSMKKLTGDEQERILNEFLTYVESCPDRIVHWGYAEVQWLDTLAAKYPKHADTIKAIKGRMFDLCKFFIDNSLIYKGMFDFSLKTVAAALVPGAYDAVSCKTGASTELLVESAAVTNSNDMTKTTEFDNIVEYNAVDCEVMKQIVDKVLNEKGSKK